MKLALYNNIVWEINHKKRKKMECMQKLQERFHSVPNDTLLSIYSQLYQRKVKKCFHRHHRKENVSKYCRIYASSILKREKEGFLLRLAEDIDFPPSLLARIILEEHFKDAIFNDSGTVTKGFISKFIKDPTEITDTILSKEVHICVENDDICGPKVEIIKREIGLKYEKLLHDLLSERGIPYCDEEDLRREGYDKTPDFKLAVPIIVNNRVVNWIESKASFGDTESHAGYLENQFWSYANRFGPGLVIYWFGFISELDVNVERGIMLKEEFPTDILTLESLLDEHEENFVLTF